LLKRFRKLIEDSKSEIEDTFKDYNNDPASKVNLLMNVFKIMKEKKFKMIAKDEIDHNSQELSRLIKTSFEKIR
jgi:frataxin-like iron-binding protein CyaY